MAVTRTRKTLPATILFYRHLLVQVPDASVMPGSTTQFFARSSVLWFSNVDEEHRVHDAVPAKDALIHHPG